MVPDVGVAQTHLGARGSAEILGRWGVQDAGKFSMSTRLSALATPMQPQKSRMASRVAVMFLEILPLPGLRLQRRIISDSLTPRRCDP